MSHKHSLKDLLEHQDFVRALARSLLFDDHAVDDVVQQTWVAALEKNPENVGKGRSWLASVVRNFSFQKLRSEKRRKTREQLFAKQEIIPSNEEILEREAARREVIEAVLELKEAYRAVILLRFFENVSPEEIAVRLEISRDTVYTRMRRGLALLRVRLNHKHGGNHRNWCLALIPIASSNTNRLIAASTLVATMTWVLLLGSLGAFAFVLQSNEDQNEFFSRPSDRNQSQLFAEKESGGGSARSTRASGRPVLHGYVLDEKRRPVSGAWVYCEDSEEISQWSEGSLDEDPFQALNFPHTVSGKDGYFAFESVKGLTNPENEKQGTLKLAAVFPEYFPTLSSSFAFSSEAKNAPVEIVLTPRVSISGRVFDAETGKPIANAKIRSFYQENGAWIPIARTRGEVRTDRDGAFTDREGRIGIFKLCAEKSNYLLDESAELQLFVEKNTPFSKLELRLQPTEWILQGRLLDLEGKPLPKRIEAHGCSFPFVEDLCVFPGDRSLLPDSLSSQWPLHSFHSANQSDFAISALDYKPEDGSFRHNIPVELQGKKALLTLQIAGQPPLFKEVRNYEKNIEWRVDVKSLLQKLGWIGFRAVDESTGAAIPCQVSYRVKNGLYQDLLRGTREGDASLSSFLLQPGIYDFLFVASDGFSRKLVKNISVGPGFELGPITVSFRKNSERLKVRSESHDGASMVQIFDAEGTPVTNSKSFSCSKDLGSSLHASSLDEHSLSFDDLPAGRYRAQLKNPHETEVVEKSFELRAGVENEVNLSLRLIPQEVKFDVAPALKEKLRQTKSFYVFQVLNSQGKALELPTYIHSAPSAWPYATLSPFKTTIAKPYSMQLVPGTYRYFFSDMRESSVERTFEVKEGQTKLVELRLD